jgi:hypothetical protein
MIQFYIATIMPRPHRDVVHVVARTKELREQTVKEILYRYGEKDTPHVVTRSYSTKKVVIVGDDY